MKGEFQKALEKAVGNVPRAMLEGLIERKIEEAGIEPNKKLVRKMVEHVTLANDDEFYWNQDSKGPTAVVSFTNEDAKELDSATRKFLEDDLPEIVARLALNSARSILRTLKSDWPEQYAWEQQVELEFRHRLKDRWDEALELLRMLLTVTREIGQEALQKNQKSRAKRNRHRAEVLLRLHARACQVTSEIITLLETGYADGAMARWRTLHEISTVATLVAEHGDELAERYLAHEVIQSKRALRAYEESYAVLGYRPPAKREVRRLEKLYKLALDEYGVGFGSEYGWAAKHLKKRKPTFSDLETWAGKSAMRSHYKMASQNVHASVKGITHQLGALSGPPLLLAGPSNAGLHEPGQNTAITLTQATFTVFNQRYQFDDVVMMKLLVELQKKTVNAFVRAGRRLKRDERDHQKSLEQGAPEAV